eukprot:PhM_4_TR9161/c0_g1_i1/m.94510
MLSAAQYSPLRNDVDVNGGSNNANININNNTHQIRKENNNAVDGDEVTTKSTGTAGQPTENRCDDATTEGNETRNTEMADSQEQLLSGSCSSIATTATTTITTLTSREAAKPKTVSLKVLMGLQLFFLAALSVVMIGLLSLAGSDVINTMVPELQARTLEVFRRNLTTQVVIGPRTLQRLFYHYQQEQLLFSSDNLTSRRCFLCLSPPTNETSSHNADNLAVLNHLAQLTRLSPAISDVYTLEHVVDQQRSSQHYTYASAWCQANSSCTVQYPNHNDTHYLREPEVFAPAPIDYSSVRVVTSPLGVTNLNRSVDWVEFMGVISTPGRVMWRLYLHKGHAMMSAVMAFTVSTSTKTSILSIAFDMTTHSLNQLMASRRNYPSDYILVYNTTSWELILASLPSYVTPLETESTFHHGKRTPNAMVNTVTNAVIAQRAKKVAAGVETQNETFRLVYNLEAYLVCFGDVTLTTHFGGLSMVVAHVISETDLLYTVKRARLVAYIVCGVITFATGFLTIVLSRSFLTPLNFMSTVVRGAAMMNVNSLRKMPASVLSEITDLTGDVAFLVRQLKEYRKYLPESALTASDEMGDDAAEGATGPVSSVSISLERVRRDGETLKKASPGVTPSVQFTFSYSLGMPYLVEQLVSQCRNRVGIPTGSRVLLRYEHEKGHWFAIRSAATFAQAITLHPDRLHLRIQRVGKMNLLALVDLLVSFVSTIFCVLLGQSFLASGLVGAGGCIICGVFAQIISNFWLTYLFLKVGQRNSFDFSQWVQERVTEVAIGMLLGVFNVSNVEVLGCGIVIGEALLLNAPLTHDLRMRMDRYSLSGVFFGAVIPLVTTCYVIVETSSSRVSDEQMESRVEVVAALAAWSLNVLLNIRRMVALTRESALLRLLREQELVKIGGGRGSRHGSRKGHDSDQHLQFKRVVFVHCVLKAFEELVDDGHVSDLDLEVACSDFYEVVFKAAKRFNGVVTHFHGGEASVLFEGENPRAMQYAYVVATASNNVCCGVVCEEMRVGNLGTTTRRSYQHISPGYFLCQTLSEMAKSRDLPILVEAAVPMPEDALRSRQHLCEVTFMGQQYGVYAIVTDGDQSGALAMSATLESAESWANTIKASFSAVCGPFMSNGTTTAMPSLRNARSPMLCLTPTDMLRSAASQVDEGHRSTSPLTLETPLLL